MYSKVVKRIIDLVISFLLILIFIIPVSVICIFIKLTSDGPAIFTQNRTGRDGKPFKLYKLRTMTMTSPQQVTPVGKFLRNTSIDELPQLFNILKGDMSFIGPRPWVTGFYDVFNDEQKRRTQVVPGLSGYAQVNGRNDITVFEKIDYDIYYVDNLSFKLDAGIFFKTIKTVLTSKSYDNSQASIEDEIKQLADSNNFTTDIVSQKADGIAVNGLNAEVDRRVIMSRVLNVATVASNLSQFDRENLKILKSMGCDIHIACNFNQGNSWSQEASQNFRKFLDEIEAETFDIDFSRNVFDTLSHRSCYKELLRLVKENDYDFIHCHTPVASAICRLVAKKTGVRVIYTAHGFHFFKGAPLKYNLIFKPVERYLAGYTDMLITINNEDYNAACKFKMRKGGSVQYIPGVGIDPNRVTACETDRASKLGEFGIPEEATVIITVAELIVRKNYPSAIRAFAGLKENCHYIICGTGPLEQELKELCKELKISDRVHFAGFRSDIYGLLNVCDIFLFTSSQEGLPVAVMEAMAAGLPAVASEIRGNCDLIDLNGGFTVDKNDIENITQSLKILAEDSLLRMSMGDYNKSKIKEFSCEKVNILMKKNYSRFIPKEKETVSRVNF